MKITYQISEVAPYINWAYFYHAWGMSGKPESEKEKLRQEAETAPIRHLGFSNSSVPTQMVMTL